jgi:hypothetical protein
MAGPPAQPSTFVPRYDFDDIVLLPANLSTAISLAV